MKKITDEWVGKEFKILWANSFDESLKKDIIRHIRGYFNIGNRANLLIDSLCDR